MTAHASTTAQALAYCSTLVAREDEDLHLALAYMDPADRPRALAVGAFMVELRQIPGAVSEPPLGEIRLQWRKDALAEAAEGRPGAHPVMRALASIGVTEADRARAETLIEARARLLYAPRFAGVDDIEAFLREAETPAIGLYAPGAPLDALAAGYALARFAPALAPDLAAPAVARAGALFREGAEAFAALQPRAAARAAFLALGPGHAARPDGRPWRAMKHLALFAAVARGRIRTKG